MKFEWKINFNEELFDKIIGFYGSNDGSVSVSLCHTINMCRNLLENFS